MKRFITKKRLAVAGATVAMVAAGAGAAFAYFTTTGNSTVTATVGNAGSWTVSGVTLGAGTMYPGEGSQAVSSAAVKNPDGNGNQGLASLTVQITGVTEGAPGTNAAYSSETACGISDFQLAETANWVVSTTTDTNDTGTYTLASVTDIAPGHYYVNGTGDSGTTGNALPSGLSVKMIDTSSAAQDRCQGATVTLTLTAN